MSIESARRIWQKINCNEKLRVLELKGFLRGEERGKKPNVPITVITASLKKQFDDFGVAVINYVGNPKKNKDALQKTLADLRNVSGVFFMLVEGDDFSDCHEPLVEAKGEP